MSEEVAVDPSPELAELTERSILLRWLQEGAQAISTLTVWLKDRSWALNSSLTHLSESDDLFYVYTPPGFLKQAIEGFDAEQFLITVSLPKAHLFFRTRFLGLDAGGLKFQIPTKAYRAQRREHDRWRVPDSYGLQVSLTDPLFSDQLWKKPLYDLSLGGCSFVTTLADEPILPVGLVLKEAHFYIHMRLMRTQLEVRHKRRLGPSRLQVGTLFREITPDQREHLQRFLENEKRKFFTQFL